MTKEKNPRGKEIKNKEEPFLFSAKSRQFNRPEQQIPRQSSKLSLADLLRVDLKDIGRNPTLFFFDEQELDQFILLAGQGLPQDECIDACFHNAARLKTLLEQGQNLGNILSSSGSRQSLGILLEVLDFQRAVQLYTTLQKTREKLRSELLAGILYPLFLLAGATGLLFFFSQYLVPAMGIWNDPSAMTLLNAIQSFFVVLWIVIAVYGAAFLQATGRKAVLPFLLRIPLFQKLTSLQCAVLLSGLMESTLSTRQILEVMKKMDGFPMASRQAQKWALKLAKGDSLAVLLKEDCALDPLFLRFFSTGLSCGRPAQMLFSYTEAGFHRLKQDLKRISALLQTAAYGSIGILALSMYQIMLAPLQMLESF